MHNTSATGNTFEDIVTEVRKLDTLEQKAVLAYIRASWLRAEKSTALAKYGKKVKPLTMAEINKIKHVSRTTDALYS